MKLETRNLNETRKGFTLFELLVSISIIGILVAIATVSYSNAQKKARDARRMEDMGNIQKAAEMYYSANSYNYPANSSGFGTSLQVFPTDPKTGTATPYTYTNTGSGYCACATLDSPTGNSNVADCTAFVAGTGTLYCVKNQQ